MKKTIFTLLFALSVSFAFSQGGFRMGAKGGANFTMLLTDAINDTEESYVLSGAPTGGLSLGYNFTYVNMGLTLGLFYKGYTQHYNSPLNKSGTPWYKRVQLSYFEIPLLLRFRPQGDKMSRTFSFGGAYFEIGPQVGFLMSATEGRIETGSVNSKPVDQQYESLNLGGVVGFGFHQVGTRHWAVTHGIRLTYNFLDVVSNPSANGLLPYPKTNALSGGYILSISYKF